MTNAIDFLQTQLVDGTSNQLDDVNKYLTDVVECSTCVGESVHNGNEMMTFKDGSVLIRIEDEVFDFDYTYENE